MQQRNRMYLTNRCHVVVHNFMFSDISQVMSKCGRKNKNTRKKVAHNMAKFVADTLTLSILVSSVIYYFPDLQSHSNMEPNEYIL